MQCIYTYVPKTNHLCSVHSVATIMYILFRVHTTLFPMSNRLYFYVSPFRSVRAVPNMAVFRSSLICCFPAMTLRYFLNDFGMIPVAPIVAGNTFVFKFHVTCISIVRSSYFVIVSASFF
jgi:hypothetical protein